LTDGDPDERVAAIDELSVASDAEDALPVLTAAARDHDASVRTAALEALADMSDTRAAVDAAMGALHDPSPDVRVAALDILADSEDPRRFDELRAARLDPDEDVRFEAEYLLGSADDVDDDTTDDSE
jgi:HEAT repeat protein